jgi:hypothetical protein
MAMPDALVALQLRLPNLDQAAGRAWLDDLLAYLARRPGPTPLVQVRTVDQTERASDGLTALLIDHRHGTDLTLHPCHDAAKATLVAYVRTWWARELPDEPEPADDGVAIGRYFDRVEDEDYRIEPATLQPATDNNWAGGDMHRIIVTAEVGAHPGKHPRLEDVRATLKATPVYGSGPDDGRPIAELRDVSVRHLSDPTPKPVADWPDPGLVCTSEYRAIHEVCEDVDDPGTLTAILQAFVDTASALLAGTQLP